MDARPPRRRPPGPLHTPGPAGHTFARPGEISSEMKNGDLESHLGKNPNRRVWGGGGRKKGKGVCHQHAPLARRSSQQFVPIRPALGGVYVPSLGPYLHGARTPHNTPSQQRRGGEKRGVGGDERARRRRRRRGCRWLPCLHPSLPGYLPGSCVVRDSPLASAPPLVPIFLLLPSFRCTADRTACAGGSHLGRRRSPLG